MEQITDEEIRNMSLANAEKYTELHPEEAWRFAKLYSESAMKQSIKAIRLPPIRKRQF